MMQASAPGPNLSSSGGPRPGPILRQGETAWRTAQATRTGALVDGADYYAAFYRAAASARRYILMSGWQFDSGVLLLRGAARPPGAEVRFLKFLDGLCRARPELSVYILAWDFHVVFALEREWLQRMVFHWMTSPRFRFRFDRTPASGGSHHQKFVVVDGALAFVGGMDICESRWDDRCHRGVNPLRLSHGHPVKPYHDVQAYLAGGDAPRVLAELFAERWRRAGGEPLALPTPEPVPPVAWRLDGGLELGGGVVGLSVTDPRDATSTVREVERLIVEAIARAEELVYAETQYFSSRRVAAAFIQRMQRPGPRLDLVLIVNERAEALKEEVAVGLRQAQLLRRLRAVARESGHALGLYFAGCDGPTPEFQVTYVHSKLLIVDDRFLTVGSANLTNRSLGVDSELHVSWEASGDEAEGRQLRRAIRRFRVSLLAEHTGRRGQAVRPLVRSRGLVARLEALTAVHGARLGRHGPPTPSQEATLAWVDPEDLPFDPSGPDAGDTADPDEPVEEGGGTRWRLHRMVTALTRLARLARRRA